MQPETTSSANHANNFDFLRLLFATLVLFTHSYIAVGVPAEDALWRFSHGQVQLSTFAVRGFFAISGYLILQSLLRSHSLKDYAFKRIIRLFPALWVVVGACVLGGYFLAGKSALAYFTDRSTLLYPASAMLHLRAGIDGVFAQNPYRYHINGSLWTIPYEMVWYILLMPLFLLRQRQALLRVLLLLTFGALFLLQASTLAFPFIPVVNLESGQIIFLGLFFVAGGVMRLFPAQVRAVRLRSLLAGLAGLALLGTLYFGGFALAQFFLIPLVVVAIGAANYPALSWVRKYGDISYGTYIWGFPVQQTLWYFFQPSLHTMLLLSIAISWALGYLSWHLLEKRVLALKLTLAPPASAAVG